MNFQFSRRIADRSTLKDGLHDFLRAEGPCFLEILCDAEEMLYPRIPAGQGYAQMILGPYMEEK